MINTKVLTALKKLDSERIQAVSQLNMDAAKTLLAPMICEDDIRAANDCLMQLNSKVRKLAMADLSAMLVLHIRSCREHKGESPYRRFTAWSGSSGNTFCGKWENCHVRVALTIFEALELTKCVEASTKKGTCRKYQINTSKVPASFLL